MKYNTLEGERPQPNGFQMAYNIGPDNQNPTVPMYPFNQYPITANPVYNQTVVHQIRPINATESRTCCSNKWTILFMFIIILKIIFFYKLYSHYHGAYQDVDN